MENTLNMGGLSTGQMDRLMEVMGTRTARFIFPPVNHKIDGSFVDVTEKYPSVKSEFGFNVQKHVSTQNFFFIKEA